MYCYCCTQETPPYIQDSSITYMNDSGVPFLKEHIFWMLPTCNINNTYDFGGVCYEVRVSNQEKSSFDPLNQSIADWNEKKGVILARIDYKGTVSWVFAEEGSTWTTQDFLDPKPEKTILTYSVEKFKALSTGPYGTLFQLPAMGQT